MVSLSGCGARHQTCDPIIEWRIETVEVDRIVSVPEHLTQPIERVVLGIPDTIGLGAALKACLIRVDQANGQLTAIRELE